MSYNKETISENMTECELNSFKSEHAEISNNSSTPTDKQMNFHELDKSGSVKYLEMLEKIEDPKQNNYDKKYVKNVKPGDIDEHGEDLKTYMGVIDKHFDPSVGKKSI